MSVAEHAPGPATHMTEQRVLRPGAVGAPGREPLNEGLEPSEVRRPRGRLSRERLGRPFDPPLGPRWGPGGILAGVQALQALGSAWGRAIEMMHGDEISTVIRGTLAMPTEADTGRVIRTIPPPPRAAG